MTNISRSPFMDEIKQTEPPREFSMPHFTSFKGDEDPERHIKCYRSAMILYRNNDDLMCKIFATTLQGESQDWFYTLPPHPEFPRTFFGFHQRIFILSLDKKEV
ncbi:hypothetical protein EV2_007737 [Malus domestica]